MRKEMGQKTGRRVSVKSIKIDNKRGWTLPESKYDVGIFFGSFERRALVSSKSKAQFKKTFIILFLEKDKEGLRESYDARLVDAVEKKSETPPVVIDTFSIADPRGVVNEILGNTDLFSCAGEKWFIDISGAAKPFFMGILGFFKSKLFAPEMHFFHPGADYERLEKKENAWTFALGENKFTWAPWLWGDPSPELPWKCVFLLGFDGNRAYDAYNELEPSRLLSFIADPGYVNDYVGVALERNKVFLNLTGGPDKVGRAHALNVSQAWEELDKKIGDSSKYNLCFIPLGPKCHAIAATLFAIDKNNTSILYLQPRQYNVHDIIEGDNFWVHVVTFS